MTPKKPEKNLETQPKEPEKIAEKLFSGGNSSKQVKKTLVEKHGLSKKAAGKAVKDSDYTKIEYSWGVVGAVGILTLAASILSIFIPTLLNIAPPTISILGLILIYFYFSGKKPNRSSFLIATLILLVADIVVTPFTMRFPPGQFPSYGIGGIMVKLLFAYYLFRGISASKRLNQKFSWGNGVWIGIGLVVLSIILGILWVFVYWSLVPVISSISFWP